MIEATGLTKRYGAKTAVQDLSFRVQPGRVTGFLGPNGAGKSTTMRMILGLDAPTEGRVTIAGRPYRELPNPPRQVGALLDAKAVHGGRSARAHLLCLAQLSGIPAGRVDEVLHMVGLQDVARKRSKNFSLGMGQRLGIAAALLGDPQVLLFDEPVNGLDPEGIHWIRNLMRALAAEGRTIFVSSHLMSEMAVTADHLIVIGRGRLLADMSVQDFIAQHSTGFARVRTPQGAGQQEKLTAALTEAGGSVTPDPDGALRVAGLDLPRISDLAHEAGVRLWELSPHQASLEQAYMQLTQGAVDYRSASDPGAALQPFQPPQVPLPPQAPLPPGYGAGPALPPGPPPYGPQSYGPPPYGQPPYGQPPFGPGPYAPPAYGPSPYGPAPYGPPPYGGQPYGAFGPQPQHPHPAGAPSGGYGPHPADPGQPAGPIPGPVHGGSAPAAPGTTASGTTAPGTTAPPEAGTPAGPETSTPPEAKAAPGAPPAAPEAEAAPQTASPEAKAAEDAPEAAAPEAEVAPEAPAAGPEAGAPAPAPENTPENAPENEDR